MPDNRASMEKLIWSCIIFLWANYARMLAWLSGIFVFPCNRKGIALSEESGDNPSTVDAAEASAR